MAKSKLSQTDKARLAELVSIYFDPKSQFKVKNDGGIVIKGTQNIIGWLTGETHDFLSVSLIVIDKMIEQKQDIKYVQELCSEAVGLLVTGGDRAVIVKKLYSAHLVDEEPQFMTEDRRVRNRDIEIQVERESQSRLRRVLVSSNINISNQIADILNNHPNIVFETKYE